MAPLDELSTFSSTKELVKQSLGFVLTSPALLDGGRAGTHPAIPASLLAPGSLDRALPAPCLLQLPAGGKHLDKPGALSCPTAWEGSKGPRGPKGHHRWLRADSYRSSCGRESNDHKPFNPSVRGTGSGPITGTSSRDSSSRSSQREEINVSAGDRATGSTTPWIFPFPGAACVECCVRGARAPHRAGCWRGCNPSLRTNSW